MKYLAIPILLSATALFASQQITTPTHNTQNMSVRASKIIGMAVENPQGESLGSINDMMVDVSSGEIQYLAVAHGGVLGVGDKLFAVPMKAFKCVYDKESDQYTLVLNVTQERFENAPGFNQDQWPDMADAKWKATVNGYYQNGAKTIER